MQTVSIAAVLAACLTISAADAAEQPQSEASGKVRVGIFDSRALALVYARSPEFNARIRKMMEEHKKAQAAGNTERVQQLEAEGKAQQQRLHEQGFSTGRVDSILDQMKDKLPEIAKQAGVDVIVSKWDIAYQTPTAVLVDVTDAMIKPFNPDEKTLRIIKELKAKPPIPMEELKKHKDY